MTSEKIDHPAHYGGKDSQFEVIKIVEAFSLGFCAGNALKYLLRAGKKDNAREDRLKALWYLERWEANCEGGCDYRVLEAMGIDNLQEILAFHSVVDPLLSQTVLHVLTGRPSPAAHALQSYLEQS